MADVMSHNPLNIQFRRALNDNKWTSRAHLVQRLMEMQLSDSNDMFIWNLTTSVIFL
jgi:hypothetical protein